MTLYDLTLTKIATNGLRDRIDIQGNALTTPREAVRGIDLGVGRAAFADCHTDERLSASARVLGAFGGEEEAVLLAAKLETTTTEIPTLELLRALRDIGGATATEALKKAALDLTRRDPPVRRVAVAMLIDLAVGGWQKRLWETETVELDPGVRSVLDQIASSDSRPMQRWANQVLSEFKG